MTEDELRARQLARLRGEKIPALESASEFEIEIPTGIDFLPPAKPFNIDEWFASQVQPQNEIEPEPFIVGHRRNEYGQLVALPMPKYPSPGQPLTKEIEAAYFKELLLHNDATRGLNDCVRYLAWRIRTPDDWDDPYCGPLSQLYDVAYNFLLGTWRARGITPPTPEQMQAWAREYLAAMSAAAKRWSTLAAEWEPGLW